MALTKEQFMTTYHLVQALFEDRSGTTCSMRPVNALRQFREYPDKLVYFVPFEKPDATQPDNVVQLHKGEPRGTEKEEAGISAFEETLREHGIAYELKREQRQLAPLYGFTPRPVAFFVIDPAQEHMAPFLDHIIAQKIMGVYDVHTNPLSGHVVDTNAQVEQYASYIRNQSQMAQDAYDLAIAYGLRPAVDEAVGKAALARLQLHVTDPADITLFDRRQERDGMNGLHQDDFDALHMLERYLGDVTGWQPNTDENGERCRAKGETYRGQLTFSIPRAAGVDATEKTKSALEALGIAFTESDLITPPARHVFAIRSEDPTLVAAVQTLAKEPSNRLSLRVEAPIPYTHQPAHPETLLQEITAALHHRVSAIERYTREAESHGLSTQLSSALAAGRKKTD